MEGSRAIRRETDEGGRKPDGREIGFSLHRAVRWYMSGLAVSCLASLVLYVFAEIFR